MLLLGATLVVGAEVLVALGMGERAVAPAWLLVAALIVVALILVLVDRARGRAR